MSMCRCKCGKIFDSDYELEADQEGNCCCDNCFDDSLKKLEKVS
jgi:hypothetical protein